MSFLQARRAVRFAFTWLMAGSLWASAHAASAQAIKQDTPDAKYSNYARTIGGEDSHDVTRILTDQSPMAGAESLFASFFGQGVYPHFTQKESIPKWSKMKLTIKQKFFNPAKVQAALDILNQVTLTKMNEYANGNYDPIVRYQAMIFIGELNQSLMTARTIVPLPEALPIMGRAALNAQLPTGVRIAALLGIKRHVELGLPANRKKAVIEAMLSIVKSKEPVPGESQEGQDWLRRRAADILVDLGQNTPEMKEVLAMDAAVAAVPAATAVAAPSKAAATPAPAKAAGSLDDLLAPPGK
ncbi:MAG TPA: hypothetical protein VFE24_11120 [Pirellulales bacterium]|jgi:hypothetical protein|nr:hypothetical protein [Pirellulales bacterium]